ncbi:hypothetical protein J6W32_00865 [bacterium]|nr:hypothetical protein [bacterium]
MTKVLTSYLQLDEFTKNKDKLIFLFATTIPNEIKTLLADCPVDVIVINPHVFEALTKKYNVKQDLTLVFFNYDFVIYQTDDKQAIINFLKLKQY